MVTEDRLISAQTKETFSPLISKFFQFFSQLMCSACSSLQVGEFGAHHAYKGQNLGTKVTLSAKFDPGFSQVNENIDK